VSVLLTEGVASAATLLLFAVAFGLARRIDNYSIVDVVWSYAFGLITLFYAAAMPGWMPRRVAIAIAVLVWSARLGTHLAARVRAHHPLEDARYVTMRREWGGQIVSRMFRFYEIQGVSVVVLATPFLVACANARRGFAPVEVVGLVVFLIGVLGEASADSQLARFKRDAANRGRVCDVGLWRYSRHPNYFFEWIIWVGFWLMACGAGLWGFATIVSPLIILYLLLRVTGIPLSEAQSLQSRGDAYRRYQRTTSAFVPLPRRTPPVHLVTHDGVDR
jgi:steroid 5-alpha reductase family enzyme